MTSLRATWVFVLAASQQQVLPPMVKKWLFITININFIKLGKITDEFIISSQKKSKVLDILLAMGVNSFLREIFANQVIILLQLIAA